MGKGNRSRNNRYDEAYQMTSSGTAVRTGAKKDYTSAIIIGVIALLLLAAILLWAFNSFGITARRTVIVSSENYEVNANMMKYYQYTAYSATYNQYVQLYYYYYYGGDAAAAENAAQQTMSQFTLDSFFSQALTTAKEALVLCEGAKAAGIRLDDKELDAIEENLTEMGDLSEIFGKGISKQDIRDAMTLTLLASKYMEVKQEELADAVTDEEIAAYVEENKSTYYSSGYLAFEVALKASDFGTDTTAFEAAKNEMDIFVMTLNTCESEAEFKSAVINYIADRDFMTAFNKNLGDATMPEQSELDDILKGLKEELIDEYVFDKEVDTLQETGTYESVIKAVREALKTTIATAVAEKSASYAEITDATEEYMKWLLSADTKALDTKIITKTDTSDYSKTVYLMLDPIGLDEDATKEVAHLLVEAASDASEEELAEAKKKAEELLAEFKAGDMTLEAFEILAEANTADSSVTYTFSKGQMVAEFEDWAFDEARKIGDVEIVQTDYGFHIMYFIGDGEVVYKHNARNDISDEKYTEYIENESAKLTVNQKAVDKYGA